MKKTLPIAPPPIYGYLHHAFPLSILAARKGYLPWFYSHYIQLSCPADFNPEAMVFGRTFKLDFYLHPHYTVIHPHYNQFISPWLESTWIDRQLLPGAGGNIAGFLMDCLEENYYIELCVDMFYVENTASFKIRHFIHEVLVYGYDGENEVFDVHIGFDEKGGFTATKTPYGDLVRAVGEADLEGHYFQHGLCLMKYVDVAHFDFHPNFICDQLGDYLYGRDSSLGYPYARKRERHIYGVRTYEFMHQYLDFLTQHPHSADIRPLHIFWEHKKCMRSRVAYMEVNQCLDPSLGLLHQCAHIESQATQLRLVFLRFQRTCKVQSLAFMAEVIKSIREEEFHMLEQVTGHLKKVITRS